MVEQAFLAGIGVAVGLATGIAVAAAMAPLLVLTPSAARPVPAPLLDIDWPRSVGTAAVLLLLAPALGAVAASAVLRRLPAVGRES
jgi:hypothetical protein